MFRIIKPCQLMLLKRDRGIKVKKKKKKIRATHSSLFLMDLNEVYYYHFFKSFFFIITLKLADTSQRSEIDRAQRQRPTFRKTNPNIYIH